jgi:hypothetical protein
MVSTGVAASTIDVGIYDNVRDGTFGDQPQNLLYSTTGLSSASSANVTASVSGLLLPGRIYWAGVRSSSNPGLRGVAQVNFTYNICRDLGSQMGPLNIITQSSVASLPNPASGGGGYTRDTAIMPAIIVKEA